MNPALCAIRDLIQEDIGNRGLRTDPAANLITACPNDLETACRSLAEHSAPAVAVVTGFYIPHAEPPCAETDGPLGAIFLARALVPLGIKVVLATDAFCRSALEAGLAFCGMRKQVPIVTLPSPAQPVDAVGRIANPSNSSARPVDAAGRIRHPSNSSSASDYWNWFVERAGPLTHLIALERVGPSHTLDSIRNPVCLTNRVSGSNAALVQTFLAEVPEEHRDRCHTMKGRDITPFMSPAHLLFETGVVRSLPVQTIGIGDGGNEIGMGNVPWDVIRRNIPGGGIVACRTPADHLIVCGVSNWGAYGLAAGVRLLRGAKNDGELFDPQREQELLKIMVERGLLVDGVSGLPTVTVDGLSFDKYVEPMRRLRKICP